MADDLGYGDVGFLGNKIVKTPHLDRMAKVGMVFRRFYASSPVCSPTRGSVLTGRHPYRYRILTANSGHILKEETTLAELLKDEGYTTGHFGKWHLGTLTKTKRESNRGGPRGVKHFAPPWEHGFDYCFSTEAKIPTFDPMLKPKGIRRKTWWNPILEKKNATKYGTGYWSNGKEIRENLSGDDSRIVMDRAIPFIEKAVENRTPFFVIVWFHAPYLPVVADEKHRHLYPNANPYRQNYYGCITALDEQMGRLRKTLRDLKVADNTLLCFCSDNGPEGRKGQAPGSAGVFRGRKRSLYEGGVRVPSIVEWPAKIAGGSSTDFPASTLDYFPTVVEALGLAEKVQVKPLDGVSLLAILSGKNVQRPKPIPFESGRQIALSGNRFKLYGKLPTRKKRRRKQNKNSAKRTKIRQTEIFWELYDLQNDPTESQNLVDRHPEVFKKLKTQLLQWRQSYQNSRKGRDYRNDE